MTDETELLYATPKTPQRRAYVEGLAAAAAGKGWQDNPYPSAGVVDYWRCWNNGFSAWQRTHPIAAVSTCWAAMQIRAGMR
jgi:hypothetical protein